MSSSWRSICRSPHAVFAPPFPCCKSEPRSTVRSPFREARRSNSSPFLAFTWVDSVGTFEPRTFGGYAGPRRTMVRAAKWGEEKSPYETLELERDADEEEIKVAYRRLAKYYHPDVYDGRGSLEKGESAESRFIKIQAAYELLMDDEKRRQYDLDNRVNPMKASQAWMEWLIKKRKAFDQRGDMAIAAWAEQQQREMSLRARRLTRSKVDPEEERRLLAKEKAASREYFNNTLKRHTLVLKKRDLMRKKAWEEDKKKVISQLLALEGLELDTDDEKTQ